MSDYEYISKRFGEPLISRPAPFSMYKGKPKINPHISRFLYKDGQIRDVFHVKPVYYHALNGEWKPLSEITFGFGNKWAALKENWQDEICPIFLYWWMNRMNLIKGNISFPFPADLILARHVYATQCSGTSGVACYPDADPETTTVDGRTARYLNDEAFTTLRNGAGEFNDSTNLDQAVGKLDSTATTDQYSRLDRIIHLFDTSAIPDTDTISAVIYSIFGSNAVSAKTNTFVGYTPSFHVCSSNPATNTALVNADYNLAVFGTTSFGSITYANWSALAYNDITLDANGRANVSKTDVSKFGFRNDADMNNSPPTWGASKVMQIGGFYADQTGTDKDPKLVVTHAAAVTAVNNGILFGTAF